MSTVNNSSNRCQQWIIRPIDANIMGFGWLMEIVGSFGAEGRRFDSTSFRHVGTSGKSFTRNCLYDGCGALWLPCG